MTKLRSYAIYLTSHIGEVMQDSSIGKTHNGDGNSHVKESFPAHEARTVQIFAPSAMSKKVVLANKVSNHD